MSTPTRKSGSHGGSSIALALIAVLAVAAAGCGAGSHPNPESTAPAEPAANFEPGSSNVIVVMTDDQAADTMRAMPKTVADLGRGGAEFENALVSFPLCCPSRASFLTGQYAHNHGVLDNKPPRGGIGALDQKKTLPVWLNRAGYRTGFVGKYLNGYGKDKNGGPKLVPPGWSDWVAATSGDKTSAYDYDLNENGKLVSYGNDPTDYKTDVMAKRASEFVRDAAPKRRPFFLWVATSAPHTDNGLPDDSDRNPKPADRHRGGFEGERLPRDRSFDEGDVSDKPGFVRKLDRIGGGKRSQMRRTFASQLESLGAVDDLVERLTRAVERAGELEETVIVFTSDNGYLRGQHRIDSGKSKVYDESVRVPLFVRGPGFEPGAKVESPVANIDLTRTIVELTGAEPDVPLDGVPLEAAVRGKEVAERRGVLLEVFERRQDQFSAIRTSRWLYAERDGERNELYDRRADPEELENLASDLAHREVRKRLSVRLKRLNRCSGAGCR